MRVAGGRSGPLPRAWKGRHALGARDRIGRLQRSSVVLTDRDRRCRVGRIDPHPACGRHLPPWREGIGVRLRNRRCTRRALFAAIAEKAPGAEAQAVDPVVLPERVSAFPSSGRTTGSTASYPRVPAFPLPGKRTRAAARNPDRLLCRTEHPSLLQIFDDRLGRLLGRVLRRVDVDLGTLRRFVRRIDAGEVLELATTGLLVQPLNVAVFGDRQWRIDVNLVELARLEQAARHAALGPERRDERHHHDEARIGHQLADFGDSPDVLDPVRIREAQVTVQAVADVVAVEQVGVLAEGEQALLDQVGDGRLAGA